MYVSRADRQAAELCVLCVLCVEEEGEEDTGVSNAWGVEWSGPLSGVPAVPWESVAFRPAMNLLSLSSPLLSSSLLSSILSSLLFLSLLSPSSPPSSSPPLFLPVQVK